MGISHKMQAATVSSRMLWPFMSVSKRISYDAQAVLMGFQVEEGQLRDPEVRLPYTTAYGLIEKLVECTGREDLGLLAAEDVKSGQFDLIEMAVRSAPTLGGAIDLLIHLFDILDNGAALVLTRGPVLSEMRFIVNCGLPIHPAYVEFVAAMLLLAARRETDITTLNVERIYFHHSNATSVSRYEKLFQGQVYFEAEETVSIFPSSFLSLPFRRANPPVVHEATTTILDCLSNTRLDKDLSDAEESNRLINAENAYETSPFSVGK